MVVNAASATENLSLIGYYHTQEDAWQLESTKRVSLILEFQRAHIGMERHRIFVFLGLKQRFGCSLLSNVACNDVFIFFSSIFEL